MDANTRTNAATAVRATLARRYQATWLPTQFDELAAITWVHEFDVAWLDRDWTQVARMLARDVELLPPGSAPVAGRAAVLAHLRSLLHDTTVHGYSTTDLSVLGCGKLGLVSCSWQLDQTINYERSITEGTDLIALRPAGADWQLVRRVQLAARSTAHA